MSMHTINNPANIKTTTIPSSNLFVPHELGKLSVTYRGREFFVVDQNGSEKAVAKMDLSQELRGISEETLEKVVNAGYFAVQKVGNDYALRLHGRLEGGWPFSDTVTSIGIAITGGALVIGGVLTGNLPLAHVGQGLVVSSPFIRVVTPTPPTSDSGQPTGGRTGQPTGNKTGLPGGN